MKRALLVVCFFTLACVVGYAQDNRTWPALLGGSNYNEANQTTALGIGFNARGHHKVKEARVAKSLNYLDNHGAGHLKAEFQGFVGDIQSPGQIAQWIDAAFEWNKDKALGCGGKQADAARKLNPRSISVVIEDRPFKVFYEGTWQWAGGWYEDRRIRVVNVAVYGMDSPRTSSLRTLSGYLVSEFGRVFGFTSDPSSGCQ